MRKIHNIVISESAPSINDLWIFRGTLMYFGSNGWEPLAGGGGGSCEPSILLEDSNIKIISNNDKK